MSLCIIHFICFDTRSHLSHFIKFAQSVLSFSSQYLFHADNRLHREEKSFLGREEKIILTDLGSAWTFFFFPSKAPKSMNISLGEYINDLASKMAEPLRLFFKMKRDLVWVLFSLFLFFSLLRGRFLQVKSNCIQQMLNRQYCVCSFNFYPRERQKSSVLGYLWSRTEWPAHSRKCCFLIPLTINCC